MLETSAVFMWSLAAASVVAAVVIQLRERRYCLDIRRKSSRYPLYAVRDELVRLIASRCTTDDDEAWSAAYRAVNRMLSLEERLDLEDWVERCIRLQLRLESDPDVARQHQLRRRRIAKACREIPGFEQIVRSLDVALMQIVRDRTTKLGLTWFRVKLYVHIGVSLCIRSGEGVRTVASVFRTLAAVVRSWFKGNGLTGGSAVLTA